MKRSRAGRPRKDEPATMRTVWRVVATVDGRQQEKVAVEQQRRSAFVLITPLPRTELDARGLLQEYKFQGSVERRFAFAKDPEIVDAFFVKKPERVLALGYVLLLVCLVFSTLERRVRTTGQPLPTARPRPAEEPHRHGDPGQHLGDRHAPGRRDAASPCAPGHGASIRGHPAWRPGLTGRLHATASLPSRLTLVARTARARNPRPSCRNMRKGCSTQSRSRILVYAVWGALHAVIRSHGHPDTARARSGAAAEFRSARRCTSRAGVGRGGVPRTGL